MQCCCEGRNKEQETTQDNKFATPTHVSLLHDLEREGSPQDSLGSHSPAQLDGQLGQEAIRLRLRVEADAVVHLRADALTVWWGLQVSSSK